VSRDYDCKQTEVTSSESLPVSHVTSVARESSVVTSSAVTSSRELMTSSSAVQQTQAPAADDVDDAEVMTSLSRDNDDDANGDDDVISADDADIAASPSATDVTQQVDLGPEVSVSGFQLHSIILVCGLTFGQTELSSDRNLISERPLGHCGVMASDLQPRGRRFESRST